MISFDEAQNIIKGLIGLPRIVKTPLVQALGKIAAADILAPMSVPSFDNSAMDGFAVNSADLAFASEVSPICLPIIETIGAGDKASEIFAAGVVHIMTGAKIPVRFDAVVPIENVKLVGNIVEFSNAVSVGQNVRFIGQDVLLGQEILRIGTRISAELIMLLASIGIAKIDVFETPQLYLYSTGNEIIDYKDPSLPYGKIYNSTAPYLMARAAEIGVNAQYGGIIGDNATDFEALVSQIPAGNIIITTGAVSMGKWDFIPQSLKNLGAKIHFHKVNIRPGKPILFAVLPNGNLFFGLPGNPISSAIGFKFFVEPAVNAIVRKAKPKTILAQLESGFVKRGDFRQFVKAITRIDDGRMLVTINSGQESFKISPMAKTNSWAILPEIITDFCAGDKVEIVFFGQLLGVFDDHKS